MRAGYLKNESLFVSMYNLGFDPAEQTTLYLEKKPSSIELMDEKGCFNKVDFDLLGEGLYNVKVKIEPMYPVILLIK